MTASRLITVAIHTYDKAVELRSILESEGISVTLQNVNLEHPVVSPGIRVRIHESDLTTALRIIENHEIFTDNDSDNELVVQPRILVPVDFGPHSITVVKIAAAIAARHRASITLLHAYIDPFVGDNLQLTDALSYDTNDAEERRSLTTAARQSMDELLKSIKVGMKQGSIAAVKLDTSIEEGVPEDVINSFAKSQKPILIVMGTRGADKKGKDIIGSVAAEVLDSCHRPVITIPDNIEPISISESPSKILFFCNGDQQDILAMDSFIKLLPETSAIVTLAILPPRRRLIDWHDKTTGIRLGEYFSNNYQSLSFECIPIETGKPIETQKELFESQKYDMIVVPNRKKKNILNRMFNPTLAHKLIFAADIPMLVIPI